MHLWAELLNHLVEVAFKHGIIQGIPVTFAIHMANLPMPCKKGNEQYLSTNRGSLSPDLKFSGSRLDR